ncbi:MAG: hypothetical protein WCR02_02195 [Sphaerochaetaceae bacterium]|jgi:multiple sugar transport system substrate-binding protein
MGKSKRRHIVFEKQNEPVVVNYWTHQDDARTALEERLITDFMRKNPDIVVCRTVHSS